MKKENFAILFPGQGSQKVGMLADFAETQILKTTYAEASEVLGYDVWGLIQEGPQEKLNLTEITQPILLASSLVLWRHWLDKNGSEPAFLAGHSLGEWTALVCSGALAFNDALRLVRLRGKFMQEAVAVGEGAMAAIIGLDDGVVEDICRSNTDAGGVVSAVNYNSPGQLVIAGNAAAVEKAMVACKEKGALKAMPLPVSAPFHTSLMKPAADRLAVEIFNTSFKSPAIPVVHNINALPESNAEKIRQIMVEQIFNAVRWVDCINYIAGKGVDVMLECGPGKVLCGLNRRINKSITSHAVETRADLDAALVAIK